MNRCMFLAAAASAGLLSCGGGGSTETKKAAPESVPAASAPAADPGVLGSIMGKVSFAGEKPPPRTLSMDATPMCAKMHKGPVLSEDVVLNSNGTLKNSFVYIKSGLPKREYPMPTTAVKVDQVGCIYTPRVVGIMVNQPLAIHNSDDINHNIHPMPKINREWNESQPPKGDVKMKTFPKEELPPILFKCNVHPWMRAWVGVSSHPFFAITGDDGTFTLKDVPPGEYTLEAWQERFGTQEIKVKLEPKQAQNVEITFKS